ncbi:hypothetical protein ACFLRN_07880 [Thermoproteota archaeon]
MKYKANAATILMVILLMLIPIVQSFPHEQKNSNVSQTIENIPYYYVDTNLSNVDSSEDKGIHSNFTAQQYSPDSIYDTLTEESSTTDNLLFLYVDTYDGAETDWTRVGTNPFLDSIDYNSNYVHASKNNYKIGDFGFEDSGLSSGTIQSVSIQIYAKQTLINNHLEVYLWDGTSWTHTVIHDPQTSWGWINSTVTTLLNSWTKIDSAKIYLQTATGAGLYEVDCARIAVNYTQADNYQIDLEVQWNNIDFNEVNEILCIHGGTMTSENIRIDAWNGSGWDILGNLTPGWNNMTATTYLTSSTFTIRFKGTTETNDTTQDSWAIDSTLLNVWS